MTTPEAANHVRGRSRFVDDMEELPGTLHAALFTSPRAHTRILALRSDRVLEQPGVHTVVTAEDIPGTNSRDTSDRLPLLAADEAVFVGQSLAMVLADSRIRAKEAAELFAIEYEDLDIVVDSKRAIEENRFVGKPRLLSSGDVEQGFAQARHLFVGEVALGGQEHYYMETHAAYAFPLPDGLRIMVATQNPALLQQVAARLLGLRENQIEVVVPSIGGSFGGKGENILPCALLTALAAQRTRRPVKLVLDRAEDLRITGKRHPFKADFQIGLDDDLRILGFEVNCYLDAGAGGTDAQTVAHQTLLHLTNAYRVTNFRAVVYPCRTNRPPNAFFRGSGSAQAVFVIEAAITHAAEEMGIPAFMIQKRNLLEEGDPFPYGQVAEGCRARSCWDDLEHHYRIREMRESIDTHNAEHRRTKKGMALIPVCCGVSFTELYQNQASARVSVFRDGSVSAATGAVEMGQGINAKMVRVISEKLSISPDLVQIEPMTTMNIVNASPTSSTSEDLNGRALGMACVRLGQRLLVAAANMLEDEPFAVRIVDGRIHHHDKPTEISWQQLIEYAYSCRINLSELAHYTTPHIEPNNQRGKGKPFSYHVFGVAAVEVTLDCTYGQLDIDRVCIVHDSGQNLFPEIDRGQIEGGVLQGIGWMTMEEITSDSEGHLHGLGYLIPNRASAPDQFSITFLEEPGINPLAIMASKAVGDPPVIYGCGAYFAARAALRSARPSSRPPFVTPLNQERLSSALHGDRTRKEETCRADLVVN